MPDNALAPMRAYSRTALEFNFGEPWEMTMNSSEERTRKNLELAESIRAACIDAAMDGYERAAISGLCSEGAWEAAISAMRMLDLAALTEPLGVESSSSH